jgi:hypothetical protein
MTFTSGDPKIYGNQYLVPLLGGSGGGGSTTYPSGGGGGGGAILIGASQLIELDGSIYAAGGYGATEPGYYATYGGGGSGGSVRLVSSRLSGSGYVNTSGGYGPDNYLGGLGRTRLDVLDNTFGGRIDGVLSQGFQPIIVPSAGQGAQLTVASVGGVPVSASPTGATATPDSVLSAQQNNPIAVVVNCSNMPLNTAITVSLKPANGSALSAVGYNNTGTQASSTATVSLNMPRGGGLIYATAATGH